MSEATVDMNVLKETLKTRQLRCAIQNGNPVLTSNGADPTLLYVAPENFVIYLLKANKNIDERTLEISERAPKVIKNAQMTEDAPTPSPAKEEKKEKKPKKDEGVLPPHEHPIQPQSATTKKPAAKKRK